MLLIDCGQVLPARGFDLKMRADLSLKAMNQMAYAAMNLGATDFHLGADFLKKVTSSIAFPFVTSNLVYKDSRLPFGKKYVIKNVREVKVGILGVMPLGAFEKVLNAGSVENIEIIPPRKALKSLLPEVRKKADLVILLSQCGFEATTLLVNNTEGIDLAISGGMRKPELTSKNIKTLVMQAAFRGTSLGFLKLTIDDTGQIIRSQREMIQMDESVAPDDQIVKMIDDAYHEKTRQRKRMTAERKRRALEQEAKELWKLTPQEYIEMLRKKESKAGGKR